MKNQELIDGLRQLADHLEEHPETPQLSTLDDITITLCPQDSPEVASIISRTLAAGGMVEKRYYNNILSLRRAFGKVEVSILFDRNSVCRRIVVGKKLVPETVVPARQEERIPAHEEEIVQWDCPSLLDEVHSLKQAA